MDSTPITTTPWNAEPGPCWAGLEAVLFASDRSLTRVQLMEILEISEEEITTTIEQLRDHLVQRAGGFKLYAIAGGYQLLSDERFAKFVEKLPNVAYVEKLSLASCEVLALLAQHRHLTRGEIERVRGVDSSGVLQSLLEKEFISSSVRMQVPGAPHAYQLDHTFYEKFSINERMDLERWYQHRFGKDQASHTQHTQQPSNQGLI